MCSEIKNEYKLSMAKYITKVNFKWVLADNVRDTLTHGAETCMVLLCRLSGGFGCSFGCGFGLGLGLFLGLGFFVGLRPDASLLACCVHTWNTIEQILELLLPEDTLKRILAKCILAKCILAKCILAKCLQNAYPKCDYEKAWAKNDFQSHSINNILHDIFQFWS